MYRVSRSFTSLDELRYTLFKSSASNAYERSLQQWMSYIHVLRLSYVADYRMWVWGGSLEDPLSIPSPSD